MNEYKFLFYLLLTFIALCAGAFKFIVHNLDKIEKLVGWAYRGFSWLNQRLEYGNVASNIQATVNTIGENLNREAPEVLPHAMKIEWARTGQAVEAFLRDGKLIVTMDYSLNRDRNLVISTLIYLGKGLLPRARAYMDKTLLRAIDFTVAKDIFYSERQSSAMSFFFENFFEPEVKETPQLRHDYTLLDRLKRAGFFSRILLRQLQYLGEKAFPSIPDESTKKECRDFAKFVEKIAIRKRGELSMLTFARSRIRTNVLLIAAEETKIWGTKAYERRIKINLNQRIEYMYICARDSKNISFAERVAEEQEKVGRIKIIKTYKFTQMYEEYDHDAICIVCSLNLLVPSRAQLDPSNVLYRALEGHIEGLRNGRIEVLGLARNQGVKSKIAVRSVVDNINVLHSCTKKLTAIETALNGEKIEFIQWNNDPQTVIISSLTPLNPDDVLEVEINIEKKEAIVKVNSSETKSKALGQDHQNVNLAMELLGWRIKVEEPAEEMKDRPNSIT